MKAKTADEFRAAVAAIEAERDDFTTPAESIPETKVHKTMNYKEESTS